jgi:NAD(P)-dependent dehydrogenase (short-subunit alcohol dehydrogenase family)
MTMAAAARPSASRFVDQVVVVTGSGGGIGASIANAFAAEGAAVAVIDVNADNGELDAGQIRAAGGTAAAFAADIAVGSSVRTAFDAIRGTLGSPHVLVNNAGITIPAEIADMTFDQWKTVIAVNLKGTFLCSHEVVPDLRARGSGKIVNVASMNILAGPRGRINYTTAKVGVVGLTRAMALKLGPIGVNVNAVSPSAIVTPMTKERIGEERWARQRDQSPLLRCGEPDDLAGAAMFLASEQACYVTGQVWHVCGGRSIAGLMP